LTFDADQNVVFQWVKATGWSHGNEKPRLLGPGCDQCQRDSIGNGNTTGEWNLSFVPGKLAMAALAAGDTSPEWDIY